MIEAEGVVCALRVDQVDHVASLSESNGVVVDTTGRPLTMIDPGRVVRRVLEMVSSR